MKFKSCRFKKFLSTTSVLALALHASTASSASPAIPNTNPAYTNNGANWQGNNAPIPNLAAGSDYRDIQSVLIGNSQVWLEQGVGNWEYGTFDAAGNNFAFLIVGDGGSYKFDGGIIDSSGQGGSVGLDLGIAGGSIDVGNIAVPLRVVIFHRDASTFSMGDGQTTSGLSSWGSTPSGTLNFYGTATINNINNMKQVNVSDTGSVSTQLIRAKYLTLSGNGSFSTTISSIHSDTISIATGTLTAGAAVAGLAGNAAVTFTGAGTFNLGTHALTGSVDFANQNAQLQLGTGSKVSQTIDSTGGAN